MLTDVCHVLFAISLLPLERTNVVSVFGTLVPVTLGLFLLLWRVWTFTVLPWLQPDEPEQIPYWIPCE